MIFVKNVAQQYSASHGKQQSKAARSWQKSKIATHSMIPIGKQQQCSSAKNIQRIWWSQFESRWWFTLYSSKGHQGTMSIQQLAQEPTAQPQSRFAKEKLPYAFPLHHRLRRIIERWPKAPHKTDSTDTYTFQDPKQPTKRKENESHPTQKTPTTQKHKQQNIGQVPIFFLFYFSRCYGQLKTEFRQF